MPASRALQFIDPQHIEAVLTAFVSDVDDRAFLRRCMVEEGPIHHRGANYVLIEFGFREFLPVGLTGFGVILTVAVARTLWALQTG